MVFEGRVISGRQRCWLRTALRCRGFTMGPPVIEFSIISGSTTGAAGTGAVFLARTRFGAAARGGGAALRGRRVREGVSAGGSAAAAALEEEVVVASTCFGGVPGGPGGVLGEAERSMFAHMGCVSSQIARKDLHIVAGRLMGAREVDILIVLW